MSFSKTNVQMVLLASALLGIAGCNQQEEMIATVEESSVTFADLQSSALSAMGAENLQRIEYTANGWEACMGQPWKISEGWARWEITDYNRVIDYSNMTSLQTAQRRAGLDPTELGGCGAQPNATAGGQQSSVGENSSWTQQLQYWLTPQGFLALGADNNAMVSKTDNGYEAAFSVNSGGVQYNLSGYYSNDFLLQEIQTWVDDSVFGDMLMQAQFNDYQDFNGVRFPASIIQKQGGHSILELTVDSFTANTQSSSEPPPRNGGGFGGGPPAGEGEVITEISAGIYVVYGGYQSVIMEFDEFIVVVDGLQSDARSRELISLAKATIPGKPIGYVVNTHLHFDHANGLREFVAEGATILTHQSNKEFFATNLANPRTLNTEGASTNGLPIKIQGVGETFALDDGTQRLELYKLTGSSHADDMLIAYIPSIKTIVEADLLQPWINPVFAGDGDGPHPYLTYLAEELDRLGIDYEQFVPIHQPSPAPTMTRADLMEAVQ